MGSVDPWRWNPCSACREKGETARPCSDCRVTIWRARWRDPAGKSRSRVVPRKIDGQRLVVKMENDKLVGAYIDPQASRVTFRAYAEEWRAIQPVRSQSAALAEQQLRTHVYPVLGDRPMGAIRPSEVQALVRGMADVLAPSTLNVVYGRVTAVFAAAVRDRVIAASPCVNVKRPKATGRADKVLSAAQVVAIADAVPAHYRALVLTGAGTGLRPGELFGLTVPAVDFLRRVLSVERQLVRVRGDRGGVELTDLLKTDRSRRTVPLAQVVVDVLAAHLAEFPAHAELGLVFTDDDGDPIGEQMFGRVWHTARQAAKVPEWAKGPHQLRHHFASLLIARGASVKVVQSRLGHASARTTLDVYGHLWPDDEDATRAAIDGELGAALAGDDTSDGVEDEPTGTGE